METYYEIYDVIRGEFCPETYQTQEQAEAARQCLMDAHYADFRAQRAAYDPRLTVTPLPGDKMIGCSGDFCDHFRHQMQIYRVECSGDQKTSRLADCELSQEARLTHLASGNLPAASPVVHTPAPTTQDSMMAKVPQMVRAAALVGALQVRIPGSPKSENHQ